MLFLNRCIASIILDAFTATPCSLLSRTNARNSVCSASASAWLSAYTLIFMLYTFSIVAESCGKLRNSRSAGLKFKAHYCGIYCGKLRNLAESCGKLRNLAELYRWQVSCWWFRYASTELLEQIPVTDYLVLVLVYPP